MLLGSVMGSGRSPVSAEARSTSPASAQLLQWSPFGKGRESRNGASPVGDLYSLAFFHQPEQFAGSLAQLSDTQQKSCITCSTSQLRLNGC